MKEEIIRRAQKNITYERVCGYLVRVERCKSGTSGWMIARGTALALFITAAWLSLLFF